MKISSVILSLFSLFVATANATRQKRLPVGKKKSNETGKKDVVPTKPNKPDMIVYADFLDIDPTKKEVFSARAPLYSDPTKKNMVGTFFLSVDILPADAVFEVVVPTTIMWAFHPKDDISKTTGTITAMGVSVFETFPVGGRNFLEYAITGGTGQYKGASGQIVNDLDANPGMNSWGVYF